MKVPPLYELPELVKYQDAGAVLGQGGIRARRTADQAAGLEVGGAIGIDDIPPTDARIMAGRRYWRPLA